MVFDKHEDCMEKIHENIKKIEIGNAETHGKIKIFIEFVSEFVSDLRKDIYAKDGLMERTGRQGMQISLQWGIMGAVLIWMTISFFNKQVVPPPSG